MTAPINKLDGAMTMTDDDILHKVAEVLGNPLLFEDLKQDFTVHTEAGDWIKFARALLASKPAVQAEAWDQVRFVRDTFKKDLDGGYVTRDKTFAVAQLTEALEGIPAAPAQSEEPVAWMMQHRVGDDPRLWSVPYLKEVDAKAKAQMHGGWVIPLYASSQPVEQTRATAVVLDDERVAFEAWARKQPSYIIKDLQRYDDDHPDKSRAGQYGHCTTANAWMIWQARAASPQPVAQPVEQTLALTDEQRAKMIADLEAEQTFISSSRERCTPDYELPRWDRLQAVIDHLSGGA